MTQVIKLKTVSFTVAITGTSNQGVPALDSSKVSFRLWAHAVAKLNPENADIAAQRVGLDTTGLVHTITKVGTAELVAAAASMELENIIANRQKLAEIAFPKVNDILIVAEEVPLVGKFLNQNGGDNNGSLSLPSLARFTPYLQKMVSEVNPRVFSSLKIKDVVERLSSVVGGQEDLVTALNNIKQDATFRIVGDFPIGPLMSMLGLKETAVSDTPPPVEDLV